MKTEFFLCLIKRDNDLLIKGLSFDRKNWFKLPKDVRSIEFHPIIAKYKSIKACLKQSKIDRLPAIRITKEIRSTYLNEKEEFFFNNELLEYDNTITEDSTVQDNQSIISSTPKITQSFNENKRQKTANVYDISDIQSTVLIVLEQLGKFDLFKNQPEVYLTKIIKLFSYDDTTPLDGLVNHFSKLLSVQLHEWYFENIFQQSFTFDEFRSLFCEHVHQITYKRLHNINMGLDDYLSSLELDEDNNKLNLYFNQKINFLQTCFNMNKKDARLMALSALDYKEYSLFLAVINDENSFNSLINFQDKKRAIEQSPSSNFANRLSEEDSEVSDLQTKLKDLEIKLKKSEMEIANLTVQNNKLNSDIIEKEDENKEIVNELKKLDDLLKKTESQLIKTKNEKDSLIANVKDQLKSLLKLKDDQLIFLDNI